MSARWKTLALGTAGFGAALLVIYYAVVTSGDKPASVPRVIGQQVLTDLGTSLPERLGVRMAEQESSGPEGWPASETIDDISELLHLASACELSEEGRIPDFEQAARYLARAAALGSAEASFRLGQLAEKRLAPSLDPASALDYYEQAASQGHVEAWAALGRMLIEGQVVPIDLALANHYIEQGLEHGSIEAGFLKGLLLLSDPAGTARGVELLLAAARAGSMDAQFTLARLLREGRHVPPDLAAATEWTRLAAEGGSTKAKVDLAMLLLAEANRSGGEISQTLVDEALDNLLEAARGNSGAASIDLARILLASHPVGSADLSSVRSFAEQAFETGRVDAAFVMALTYAGGDATAQATARSWLELGSAGRDWRSRYARQLLQQGESMAAALQRAADASYQEFAHEFVGGHGTTPDFTPPKPVHMSMPPFPPEMVAINAKGGVITEFVVGNDGRPHAIQIVESTHPQFDHVVLEAARNWRFEPAVRAGVSVPVRIRLPVRFRAQ